MAKPKITLPAQTVRTRRAYFDCRFGQLHVRTAFPTTGGFDEHVTLFCLHAEQSSSRMFVRLLPQIAETRSVYAPDLPGRGESDPSPADSAADAAGAMSDLANDLRLRKIDLLGVHSGANVALELAISRPELVRRLVLMVADGKRLPAAKHPVLVLQTPADKADALFDTAPKTLAKEIAAFLSDRS